MSKYAEIKDKYPQDRGSYAENALAIIEEYQETGKWGQDDTIAEAEARAVIREEWNEIAGAMNVLGAAVNGRNAKDVAKAMCIGISGNHRTLQNQAVAAMFEFLRIYKDTAYDLRNWSAVVAAAQVSQMAEDEGIVFPFI